MTRKITMNGDEPSEGAEQGFASLADQWIEKNWYLPPSGDHSWREREAQRMFGGEPPVNDKMDSLPVEQAGPAANEIDGPYRPRFRRAWALNILLPVSLATCVVSVVVAIFVPGIFTSSLSSPQEPKAPSDTPLHLSDETTAREHVTLRMIDARGSDHQKNDVAAQAPPQPVARTVVSPKADRKIVLPHLRPQMPVIAKREPQRGKRTIRVANAKAVRAQKLGKTAVKSLPPIGEDYFASHARAVTASKSGAVPSRPIGQAYFGSRSRITAD